MKTQSMDDRRRGTVMRVVPDRGFFFIRDADGHEYFGHISALEDVTIDELQPQQTLTFVPTTTPKGKRAEAIRRG